MPQVGTTTTREALDQFMADRAYRCTERTLKFYEGKLTPFLVWLEEQGVTRIAEVKVTHARKYLAAVDRRGASTQYQNNIGRAIRAFLIFCHDDGYLPERIQIYSGTQGFPEQRIVSGKWEISDGLYRQTVPDAADYVLNAGVYASNYTVEADVMLPQRPDAGGDFMVWNCPRSSKARPAID